MNFLAPLFLAGALAVALPVLFHLIRRSVKERTVFSSLMFLQPSPPRLTRRSRLEHLLLLALRCLALCLLAAGFARPFIHRAFAPAQTGNSARRVAVLLDTSASMRRQGAWEAARAKAEQLARAAGPADTLAFYTFDRQLRALITFDEWAGAGAGDRLALARARLADAGPGWSGTSLDTAIVQASELFGDKEQDEFAGTRQVVVISDFQEGSRLGALQGYEWPRGVEVVPERIELARTSNAGLQLLTDPADAAVTVEPSIRVRVSNASDSRQEQFQVGWAGAGGAYLGKPVEVYVPAGQNRLVALPVPGTNAAAGRVQLRGDDEPFDNNVWVIPPTRSQVTVLYLGNDSGGDAAQPLFFLERALQETRRQAIRIARQSPSAPLSAEQAGAASLFVVTAAVADAPAAVIRDAVAAGKSLLFAPTDAAAAAALGKLLGGESIPVIERKPDSYAMLAGIEFQHPLFAPFADSRFSDFTRIHFWKYRAFDPASWVNARTLARFDTGDPYIAELAAGKGRVFVFASGWHPADSQLALSSKFVPLLYSLVELSGAPAPPPVQYFVGSTLPLGERAPGAPLVRPDGASTVLNPGQTNFAALEPGIYSIAMAEGPSRFAVNLEPAESRTAILPADGLERLGVPGAAAVPLAAVGTDRKVRLQNEELESRQKLWRWLIAGTLAVLVFETWLAGRTARGAVLREEVT